MVPVATTCNEQQYKKLDGIGTGELAVPVIALKVTLLTGLIF
jgi:hypothetical protein